MFIIKQWLGRLIISSTSYHPAIIQMRMIIVTGYGKIESLWAKRHYVHFALETLISTISAPPEGCEDERNVRSGLTTPDIVQSKDVLI